MPAFSNENEKVESRRGLIAIYANFWSRRFRTATKRLAEGITSPENYRNAECNEFIPLGMFIASYEYLGRYHRMGIYTSAVF